MELDVGVLCVDLDAERLGVLALALENDLVSCGEGVDRQMLVEARTSIFRLRYCMTHRDPGVRRRAVRAIMKHEAFQAYQKRFAVRRRTASSLL